jgi:Mn2+/Fe2+ NRAMP family transporter
VLLASMAIGTLLNLTPIDPFKALFWSAVINGVAAAPMMVVIPLLAQNTRLMKKFAVTGWVERLAWTSAAVMGAATVTMFATMGKS